MKKSNHYLPLCSHWLLAWFPIQLTNHDAEASALLSATKLRSASENNKTVVIARSMCSLASNSSVHKYFNIKFFKYYKRKLLLSESVW